jgi:hypothetical protein
MLVIRSKFLATINNHFYKGLASEDSSNLRLDIVQFSHVFSRHLMQTLYKYIKVQNSTSSVPAFLSIVWSVATDLLVLVGFT